MPWETDWGPGNWRSMLMEYHRPTWRIPPFLLRSIGARETGTTMPAGPLVDKYSVTLEMGTNPTEYGHPPGIINATIVWRPEAYEILAQRDELLGPHRQTIDEYHSQFAVCPTWTLLNQLQRKINRTRQHIEYVEDRAMRANRCWADAWLAMNQNALDAFQFDKTHVDAYVSEHDKSSIIPPTRRYGSVKWVDLETSELRHLYNSAKGYLEDKLANWDKFKRLQWKPEALGQASRARSPKVTGLVTEYEAVIGQARDVGYNPYISTWYAWMPGDGPKKVYEPMIQTTENRLGVEIGFPPIMGGNYWKKIAEYKDQGCRLVNGDGTNWDSWVTILLDDYSTSAEKGTPSLISGQAMTTPGGTHTNHMISEDHIDIKHVQAIFALGDDKLVILNENAPDDAVREIPGVWEFDRIATDHVIVLGLVILDDHKGTFPGMYRPTIDSGDARIPINVGQTKVDIGSKMSDENRDVYYEIMGQGTLQGIPFIDRIAATKPAELWEGWRRNRYEYLGGLEADFAVLYTDDHFEL